MWGRVEESLEADVARQLSAVERDSNVALGEDDPLHQAQLNVRRKTLTQPQPSKEKNGE